MVVVRSWQRLLLAPGLKKGCLGSVLGTVMRWAWAPQPQQKLEALGLFKAF